MGTFYDEWLAAGERIQEEFRRSPMIAHDGRADFRHPALRLASPQTLQRKLYRKRFHVT